MRADARRNLERILLAARELVIERGPAVPLDDIARKAGVGSGTLYRRFPDRATLLHAVAADALTRTVHAARTATDQESDPFEALARYMREALDQRVSAVLPALLGTVDLENDPDLAPLREEAVRLLQDLIDRAHAAGTLPPDVTFDDIGMMLVRFARPLPGPMPDETKHELARRHLELFVRGLRMPVDGDTTDGLYKVDQ
ncbi:TetR/AcrR family transcriptional regulator [Actinomadura rupiterrae]|uniref:TetR/AcrR family transcriptional regulator n=1 Tax=Actinomadura rupiterrae TaxID=559627 RepID=UPI0020A5AFEB|nr:TetR/AcrR family transcriptional regulator [Actinomadura rupiterrae]MCP2342665.1 AcrR family transcriptional regulator [Actinomadura rupiterrae]